jgi:hypothetical protein
VAIQQAAAQALAAVQRARALFGPTPQPPPPPGASLETAAQSAAGAGQRAAVLSGDLVDRHQQFVGQATQALTSNGHTDTALDEQLGTTATLTQAGGRHLDAIVARTRTIAQSAATARTPAAQRAVLQALHTEVSQANSVVTSTQQQASAIAGQIRGLDYRSEGRIQAAGFRPGGAPQEPAPKPPPGTDPDDAERRRDQAIVADPNADPTARRLAQERLNDLKDANFIGPLPADPVMGGDARTRAEARLQFRRLLESGQGFPGSPPLTPDQATQLLDRWEAEGRDMILGTFAQRLQVAGVSPTRIRRAIDDIQNGKTPGQVLHDAADNLSFYGGALGGGAESHGAALPGGRHWGDAPVWTESDARALEAFGRKLTIAGVGLDAVITSLDVAHGAPTGPAAAELGGRTLGGIAGAAAVGALWGSFVGPEGALVAGFLGGVAGAFGGDEAVKWALGR